MNSPEFKDAVCRICMDKNVVLDWNNALVKYDDTTYKDCYHKYTQLKPLDTDPFSSMLCQNCLNSLENVHVLILKAIDSYNFFQEVNCMNSEMEGSTIIEEDINYCSTDFETVHMEKIDRESLIQYQYKHENLDKYFKTPLKAENDNFEISSTHHVEIEIDESFYMGEEYPESDIDEFIQIDNSKDNVSKSMKEQSRKSKRTNSIKRDDTYDENNRNKQLKIPHHTRHKTKVQPKKSNGDSKDKETADVNFTKRRRERTRYKSENASSMCAYCSKILHNKYALQKHEKTHNANRERKATCPICGVKYFEESYLKAHMHIHNENRVKKHKCEFCEKAFYEKGALNVHRRIHLGQMIPCTLCSKEFFRQVDLDIHMNSHSATAINVETKKRSKYWVRCKYCDKNIMSTSFRSHTASHLNEPLMKCSLCNKEFFRRDSCTQHVKSVHKKSTEEYNDFIVTYNKSRLSHLYLEQTAEIQVNEN